MNTQHPPRNQLIAFGLGKLSDPHVSQIAEHLDSCEDCSETIVNLQDDTFVSLLKKSPIPAADLDQPNNPHLEATQDAGITSSYKSDVATNGLPEVLHDHAKFNVLGLLGSGGMGDVYKAEHKMMNRIVALKVINTELIKTSEGIDRFRREVQAAARLRHANIVTAYDAEQAGDLHYLVMEFVDGENLNERLLRDGPLAVQEACDFIRQAAEGLQHAHDAGMVHRDIKPHNLMIEEQTGTMLGTATVVKILDFGLAGFVNELVSPETETLPSPDSAVQLTQAGTMMGTADFIAPEQAVDAHSADIRADIYSLGCTLYTLLAGRPPYQEKSVPKKIQAHCEQTAPSIADFRDDIPNALVEVLAKMMAKDPANRYQQPAEVVAALTSIDTLTETASLTQRSSSPESSQPKHRWLTRRTSIISGLAGFIALAAAVILFMDANRTTLRFEILDPNVEVRFSGKTINLETPDNGSFSVEPLKANKFAVYHNGERVEHNSLTLRQGQKVVLKVNIVERKIKIDSDVPDVELVQEIVQQKVKQHLAVKKAAWQTSLTDCNTLVVSLYDQHKRPTLAELKARGQAVRSDEQTQRGHVLVGDRQSSLQEQVNRTLQGQSINWEFELAADEQQFGKSLQLVPRDNDKRRGPVELIILDSPRLPLGTAKLATGDRVSITATVGDATKNERKDLSMFSPTGPIVIYPNDTEQPLALWLGLKNATITKVVRNPSKPFPTKPIDLVREHLRAIFQYNPDVLRKTYAKEIMLMPGHEFLKDRFELAEPNSRATGATVQREKLLSAMQITVKRKRTKDVVDKFLNSVRFSRQDLKEGESLAPPDKVGPENNALKFDLKQGDVVVKVATPRSDYLLFQVRPSEQGWQVVAEYVD